jgi:hypothetical protein
MVSFQTKNPSLGKFRKALDWKILIYFMAIWDILQTFYDHLVHFVFIWYIFPVWVIFTKKNLATMELTRINFSCGIARYIIQLKVQSKLWVRYSETLLYGKIVKSQPMYMPPVCQTF